MARPDRSEGAQPRHDGFGYLDGTALVIGGSGTIGREVCTRLAVLGSDVVLTYAGNRDGAEATGELVREHGTNAQVRQADLGDAVALRGLVDDVAAEHGAIHTVILAASPINRQEYVSRLTSQQYRDQLALDAGGLFDLAQAALPHLRASKGSLTAITTVANRRFVLRDVLSSGPKAANEALVRAIAAEEGRFGVRANAVGVGILGEGMTDALIEVGDFTEAELEIARGRIAMRRLGQAADIADMVVYLASPRAQYVTGQWIDVDGGYSL